MFIMKVYTLLICVFILISSCHTAHTTEKNILPPQTQTTTMPSTPEPKTEEQWKQVLTAEEYRVLREAGTEAPYTGKYTNLDEKGNYYCKACGNLLFSSDTKYHSGCGWPAFYDIANGDAVITREDNSHGMKRIEVLCKKCHSHLGHVFPDGPQDKTGIRYCINSISLDFKTDSTQK